MVGFGKDLNHQRRITATTWWVFSFVKVPTKVQLTIFFERDQWWSFSKDSMDLCQVPFLKDPTQIQGGGNSKIFYFHPYLGKWSNFTNIFQMGWNHQLEMIFLPVLTGRPRFWYHVREMMRISGELSMEPRTDRGEQVWGPQGNVHEAKISTHWRRASFHQGQQDAEEVGKRMFFPPTYCEDVGHVIDIFVGFGWMIFHWFSAVIILFFKHATIWSLIVAQKSHRLDLFFNTKSMEDAIT